MIPRGNHATDMIEAADRNYEWQERREWEKAHLPPAGDGVKDGKTDDNAEHEQRAVASRAPCSCSQEDGDA